MFIKWWNHDTSLCCARAMREGSQGLERIVLTHDHRATAYVFNETNDSVRYLSKCHGFSYLEASSSKSKIKSACPLFSSLPPDLHFE